MNDIKISILVPTRARTDALSRSVFSLFDLANNPKQVELVIGIDRDDEIGINHYKNVIKPELESRGVKTTALLFEPLTYLNLNVYFNTLAEKSSGDWLIAWCDDGIMQTQGWDDRINEYTGEFKLLKVHTHNEHPWSIFPIVPRDWYELMGHLSRHQLIDTWTSMIAYFLNIMQIIEVDVLHDRSDLTGNNDDSNFNSENKRYLEGNPSDPRDFYHPSFVNQRLADTETIAQYMKSRGIDISFWENVKAGKQDPWEECRKNDINKQTTTSQI